MTVDAMHTQNDTAQVIIGAGGDYVFTVKANQPKLYAACKNLPWPQVPAHATVQTGHGRRVHRAIKAVTAPAWITFTGATQVAQVRRTTTRAGKKTVEVVYVITSADHRAAPPAVLASRIQATGGSRTEPIVESARGAVAGLLPVRFPGPLAEPGVPVSRHRALHGVAVRLAASAGTTG